MKFSFSNIPNCKARHGKFAGFFKNPDKTIHTPLLLLNTKGGSVPHITHEVLQLLTKDDHILQMPLTSTILSYEAVKDFKKGLAHFCGLKDYFTYCSVQDPSHKTRVGYNKQTEISLWCHEGRHTVNAEEYMNIMEAFRPDMYQILANTDTNSDSSKKKIVKTIQSSKSLFDECIKRHKESEELKKSSVVGVIGGGFDIPLRTEYAKYMSDLPVDGYSIEGLHNNGPDVETMETADLIPVLEETLNALPENKFRILPGSWNPRQVLKMVQMGIDVFDSSLPYILTERMSAFSFGWKSVPIDTEEVLIDSYEISLRDISYKEDFGPIKENCSCLPCKKHTRAYIYHLIENKELLATVLLMMHNLHHYMEFFKAIREACNTGQRIILTQ